MATQRAVIIDGPGVAKVVSDRGIAPLRPDYMLVKVKAVALYGLEGRRVEAPGRGARHERMWTRGGLRWCRGESG